MWVVVKLINLMKNCEKDEVWIKMNEKYWNGWEVDDLKKT